MGGTSSKDRLPTMYGIGAQPVIMQSMRLSDDLLDYLQHSSVCELAEEDLTSHGFDRCVDYPMLPDHIYYEGYFHTLAQDGPVSSVHPRQGMQFDKPTADSRLRAFCEAVREVNSSVLAEAAKAVPSDSILAAVFKRGWAFGDLALQVHYGTAVDESCVGWHMDAVNSALHMAVSLRGSRVLKSKLTPAAPRKGERQTTQIQDSPQSAGDVYVSNPHSFVHGVEYPTSDWSSRVVACQIRLLMTEEEMFSSVSGKGSDAIAHALAASGGRLRMPTLEEVLAAERSIARREEPLK